MRAGTNEYIALHEWVRYHKGKPSSCDKCGDDSRRRYEWSNISGKYKRDLSDYRSLCVTCHRRLDRANMCMKKLHNFTPENTYTNPSNGCRECRACKLIRQRKYRGIKNPRKVIYADK